MFSSWLGRSPYFVSRSFLAAGSLREVLHQSSVVLLEPLHSSAQAVAALAPPHLLALAGLAVDDHRVLDVHLAVARRAAQALLDLLVLCRRQLLLFCRHSLGVFLLLCNLQAAWRGCLRRRSFGHLLLQVGCFSRQLCEGLLRTRLLSNRGHAFQQGEPLSKKRSTRATLCARS